MIADYQKPKFETLFKNSFQLSSRLACSGTFVLDQSACNGGPIQTLENCQFSQCVPFGTQLPPAGLSAVFQCQEDPGPFTIVFADINCVSDNCDSNSGSTCTITFEFDPTPPPHCTVTSIIQNGQEVCGGNLASNEVVSFS
jgi:hypothetical protein